LTDRARFYRTRSGRSGRPGQQRYTRAAWLRAWQPLRTAKPQWGAKWGV